MLLLYSIIFITISILIIIFRNYNKAQKDSIDTKKHPFHLLYGFSFLLIDVYKSILSKFKGPNFSASGSTLRKKILMLYPHENIQKMEYQLISRRLSFSMVCILLFMLLGILSSSYSLINSSNHLESLERPTDGSDKSTYSLQVNTDETTEYVDIDVSKKIYEYGEIVSIFDKYKDDIIKQLLGNNSSLQEVTYPLNFFNSIGTENINLSWQPEDVSYIDYNGNILYENIDSNGTLTTLYVNMELDGVTASLVIGITLYPASNDDNVSLKAEIENYIDQNNNSNSTSVILPSNISSGSVSFAFPQDNNDSIYLILSILFSIILYFLVSRETSTLLKNRNNQMLEDYPEIVSKLLLLSNAGLTITNSLKKIVDDYRNSASFTSKYAYEEISITLNSLSNGNPESTAYSQFGKRCGLMPYIKLGTLLEQSIHKGSKELSFHLNNEVRNAFENHKSHILTKSKQAETKMLLPMVIILIIIMALIIVPSFMTI